MDVKYGTLYCIWKGSNGTVSLAICFPFYVALFMGGYALRKKMVIEDFNCDYIWESCIKLFLYNYVIYKFPTQIYSSEFDNNCKHSKKKSS